MEERTPRCNGAAVTWYHQRLLSAPDAGPARDYLRSRGYDGSVVRQFRLGWAPDDWDALSTSLKLSEKVLTATGLGFVNRRGRRQDAFRGRIIFPICDPSGHPSPWVAASSRPVPVRRPPTQPGARTEVQEFSRDAHLLEAAHPLRAELGQEGHRGDG